MSRSYTRAHFNKDLKELSSLIRGFKQTGGKSDSDTRWFTVVEVNRKACRFGRYKGDSPLMGATKAVSRICDKKNITAPKCKITFSIQETTRGSAKKIYGPYKGELVAQPKNKWWKPPGSKAWVGKYKSNVSLLPYK